MTRRTRLIVVFILVFAITIKVLELRGTPLADLNIPILNTM